MWLHFGTFPNYPNNTTRFGYLDAHNKSLDASGGSVFRIMIGPAMLE
jgi:hypothetical protein